MKAIKSIIAIFLVTILTGGALVFYITFIERHLLIDKKHKIIIDEKGENSLRVVQFTDTQLGEYYTLEDLERAVKKINKLNADIVVFTGDLIDNASKYEDLFKVDEVLSKIEAKLGKYAIYGNHDYGGGAVRYYEKIMKDSGFTVLKNSSEKINIGNKTINILGADDALMGNHSVEKTMKGIKDKEINLLLIHEPDLIDEYKNYSIDLALGGHSHGGQVYIPFYGPAKKNSLSEKYNRGMFKIDTKKETSLYVSTGLGNTKVPFRFLTIPEVAVFDIKI